jgi:hypothetical protein
MNRNRAEFAAWVRANHPDIGGDPAAFATGLERRRAADGVTTGSAPVSVFRSRGGLWPVARWLRRKRRGARRVV